MKLIVGLGNPGEKYKNNRHNVGFMVADALAFELGISSYELSKKGKAEYGWGEVGGERVEIYKPQTFMNDSGISVAYAKEKHQDLKIEDIYVIHDDLDIPLGSYKIQLGKGPKDHKGLESVDSALRTSGYWHVRVGVDNRNSENRTLGEEYVLQDFSEDERNIINLVTQKIIDDLVKSWRNKL